jgi:tRNA-Thr(GGU) m(6)t(6)A37 methyltransferase TsaA
MLRGLEEFSHLWLIFVFHETADEGWSPMIHPPRLGGREKRGVFSTRSTHRPNPIGMSVVERGEWKQEGSRLTLKVHGIDLLDSTPILDIKPYLPYADHVPDAIGGFASRAPLQHRVTFSELAENQLESLQDDYPDLRAFIASVLAQDPRPAYRRNREKSSSDEAKQYGMSLYDLNIKWKLLEDRFEVLSILPWARDTEISG